MPVLRSLLSPRPLVTLPETATALEAAQLMTQQRVGAVLVVAEGQAPLGIFTERDLMRKVVAADRPASEVTLGSVMTRELFTARPDAKIADVRQELQQRHIRHLPVIEDGRVLALLSLRDLLRADLEACSTDVHELQRYIQGTEDLSPPEG